MRGKLVRDRIPELMIANGQTPNTRILQEDAFLCCLEQKLDEEVREFHEDRSLEELADILEVILALADAHGSREAMIAAYEKKHRERGGFRDRIYLSFEE